jgi:hypothetical protein
MASTYDSSLEKERRSKCLKNRNKEEFRRDVINQHIFLGSSFKTLIALSHGF